MITFLIVVLALCGVAAALIAYASALASMYPETLRTTESHTVATHDLWRLRLLRYRKGRTEGEPVLFVHGVCVNQHSFTSPAGGCLADYLSERGYDCWTVDLRGCRSSEPPFERDRNEVTMDDFLLYDLPSTMKYIRKVTGYDRIHWIGHSLGGMLLYAYVLEHGSAHIASGTTLGAPPGFAGLKHKIPFGVAFAIKRFPRATGAVLRACVPFFMGLKSQTKLFPTNMRNLHPKLEAVHVYNMFEAPLPKVYRALTAWLVTGRWTMKNGELNVEAGLSTLQFPLLAVYGVDDPFIPVENAERFVAALPHDDKKILILGRAHGCRENYSHCDLAFAQHGAKEVFGPVAQWLAAHSSKTRLRAGDEEIPAYTPLLNDASRAKLLTGQSFAHITGKKPKALRGPEEREADAALARLEERSREATDEGPAPERSPGISEASAGLESLASTIVRLKSSAQKARNSAKGRKPLVKKRALKTKAASRRKNSPAKKKASPKKKAAPKKSMQAKEETKEASVHAKEESVHAKEESVHAKEEGVHAKQEGPDKLAE